jgi:oligopeptide/dipeptide ABC transporter ATP-binding protein
MAGPLLEVRGLSTSFATPRGSVRVLDALDLELEAGRILGLVGESGSGKSVTALSTLRLINAPGTIDAGEVQFDGVDLMQLSERQMRDVRGKKIAMIFQDPRGYLDPVARVGSVLSEVYRRHEDVSRRAAKARAIEMLGTVGLASPERVMRAYPHELSGGMAQRVMIALALACGPQLLIADEPTTALDVTVQMETIRLLRSLRDTLGLTIMLITHDLGVVAETCDEVAVMYAGRLLERGDATAVLERPMHPYTVGLLRARPTLGNTTIAPIAGDLPDLLTLEPGCRFAPRCPMADDHCRAVEPDLRPLPDGHRSRCHYAERVPEVLGA